MELIPFVDDYVARFADPGQREVGMAATLCSLVFTARGVLLSLEVDAAYSGAVAALDRSAVEDVAARTQGWFGEAMTPADVAALLRPSLSQDLVLEVRSPAVDSPSVLVQGRDGTLADARELGLPRRVTAFVRQTGVRIAAESAGAEWELASIDLTPTVSAPVPSEEDAAYHSETEPPEDVCLDVEARLRGLADDHLAACRDRARDAEEVAALAHGLDATRGTDEWKARVAELASLLPAAASGWDPEEDGTF